LGAVGRQQRIRETAFCRISLRTFERFVQRDLPAVQIGARVFFAAEDLQGWLDDRRNREWVRTETVAPNRVRKTREPDPMSRDAAEILAQLRRQNP
jgi:hypothetical protein